MKSLAVLALCGCGMASVSQAADLRAQDAVSLETALGAAAPGDRILLAPGAYGDVTIGPRKHQGAVTITASEAGAPPLFRSILVRDAEQVTLQSLSVSFGIAADPLASRAIEVRRSSEIQLEGLMISSSPNGVAGDDAYGIIIRNSRGVSVTASRIHDVFRGVAIFSSDEVFIGGNSVQRAGSDGLVAQGAVGLTIVNNSFSDFTPADPVKWHPDAIQLWSRGGIRANERIVIRGNVVRRGQGGPTQGIFIKTPEIATRDILIEDNRVEQSMGQGIFVQNGINVTIRGNVLVAVEPFVHPPAIEVRAPFENAVVERNEAPGWRLPKGVKTQANRTSD